MNDKREYGDYQTPEYYSLEICKYLKEKRNINPSVVIEPTCGKGSFIKSSSIFDASEIWGIEINPEYCKICKETITDPRVRIVNADFFSFNFEWVLKTKGDILVVGNPPWVNNSTLSNLNSNNLPAKTNFKGLKGLDAITGASNFDICEFIILQLVELLRGTRATIAMLCKTSVARNVFLEMKRTHVDFNVFDILEINSKQVFGISVHACLLVIELAEKDASTEVCNIYSLDNPELLKGSLEYSDGKLYRDAIKSIDDFSGMCCFEWRQGIKHDCSKVMELSLEKEVLVNGFGERVDIEPEYLFPLIKSSMFKSPVVDHFNKYVIVTQKRVKESTLHIQHDAPKTWDYLIAHKKYFLERKSSIYKNSPDFSMFGIGDYSFTRYKVGISGFYKQPFFSVLTSHDKKPVMIDDTSYFICFPTYDTAYTAMLLLNSERVQKFLSTMAFLDAKRPYTKKVLARIDFHKILQTIETSEIINTETRLGLGNYFEEKMLADFALLPELTCQSTIAENVLCESG